LAKIRHKKKWVFYLRRLVLKIRTLYSDFTRINMTFDFLDVIKNKLGYLPAKTEGA
jgi:hypothetical protein